MLAHQTEYVKILIWLVIAGFVRGAALINFAITISEYATLEKLPAAFGLHNVGKGLFVVTLGPLLGQYFHLYRNLVGKKGETIKKFLSLFLSLFFIL